ncbi:MAG: diguanylate cyclase, partial [Frankiales bacterium]
EFVLLLPEQDLAGASIAVERVRAAVQARALVHPQSEHGVVTISGGLASSSSIVPLTAEGLLHAADLALFESKAVGRNTLTVVSEAPRALT